MIKKFSLELQMKNSTNSYSLQRRYSELVKNRLANDLDKLFAVYFPGNHITRIQKIEIDIGNITADEADNVFIDKCLEQLAGQFKNLQKKSPEQNGIERSDPQQNVLEQFFYFLHIGRLPWSATTAFFNRWEEQVLQAVTNKKAYFNTRFATLLADNPITIVRLVLQFNKDFIEQLFYACEPLLKKEIAESMLRNPATIGRLFLQFDKGFIEQLFYACESLLKKEIAESMLRSPATIEKLFLQFDKDFIEQIFHVCEKEFKKEIAELVLHNSIIVEKLATQFSDVFIEELFSAHDPLLEKEIAGLMPVLQKVALKNPSLQIRKKILGALLDALYKMPGSKMVPVILEINEWFRRQSTNLSTQQFLPQSEQELELILKQLGSNLSAEESKKFQKKDVLNSKDESNKKVIEKKEALKDEGREPAVFIDNAGLVILHPFLTSLFENVGLMHNNSFIDEEAKYRAVHLLQYMVTGQEQLPEYLMPLNKILCGIPDEMHIDRFVTLQQEEKKEANELLQAVIEHWSALKNSSVEALQETFLQRRGKLDFIEEDKFWKLHTERTGVDVLLDKIPWGYSNIQLPWMQYRLITEW